MAIPIPRYQQLALEGARHVMTVDGELDIDTAPGLADALDDAIQTGKTHVVVDMSGVTFVDSTAMHVLVAAARELRQQLGKLVLVCTDPHVRRLMELTSIDLVAPVFGSREAALRSLLDE